MQYLFKVELLGEGETAEQAWDDACSAFSEDPGEPSETTPLGLVPEPEGLSSLGQLAFREITAFLHEREMLSDEKCFYSPQSWRERGEAYGTESELVVVHDGGDHVRAFAWEWQDYDTIEALSARLRQKGLYIEQCTTWYSAVYKIRSVVVASHQ